MKALNTVRSPRFALCFFVFLFAFSCSSSSSSPLPPPRPFLSSRPSSSLPSSLAAPYSPSSLCTKANPSNRSTVKGKYDATIDHASSSSPSLPLFSVDFRRARDEDLFRRISYGENSPPFFSLFFSLQMDTPVPTNMIGTYIGSPNHTTNYTQVSPLFCPIEAKGTEFDSALS